MKTRFLFSTLLLVPVLLFAQKKKYMAFDEQWSISTSPENTYYSCNCYVNDAGKFIGKFRCYNIVLDALVKEYSFDNDVLHGEVKEYYNSGQLKLEAEYAEGLPIHEWKEYDEDGTIVLQRTFNEQSQIVQDYYQEQSPYDNAMAFSHKKEEPPIYTTDCIRVKVESQKYTCSEEALAAYLNNPPIPEIFKSNPNYSGRKFECLLMYTISEVGIVESAEIVQSTGDDFLDQLAQAHILNMVPFEAAKQYGVPVPFVKDAQIIFQF